MKTIKNAELGHVVDVTADETGEEQVGEVVDLFRSTNTRLRLEYLAVCDEIETADARTLPKLERKLDDIADEFVRANLGLAGTIWRRYVGGANPSHIEDFIAVARAALWMAFLTWDPAKGTFGTWSQKEMFGQVRRAVAFYENPHLRFHEKERLRKSQRESERILRETGVAPTDEELAEVLGVSVAVLQASRRESFIYLDAPVGDGGETLNDLIGYGDDDDPVSSGVLGTFFNPTAGAEDDGTLPSSLLETVVNSPEVADTMLTSLLSPLTPLERVLVLNQTGLHYSGLPLGRPLTLADMAFKLVIGREILRRQLERSGPKIDERAVELARVGRSVLP